MGNSFNICYAIFCSDTQLPEIRSVFFDDVCVKLLHVCNRIKVPRRRAPRSRSIGIVVYAAPETCRIEGGSWPRSRFEYTIGATKDDAGVQKEMSCSSGPVKGISTEPVRGAV